MARAMSTGSWIAASSCPKSRLILAMPCKVQAPDTMADVLDGLAKTGTAVLIDEAATPVWMVDRLTEGSAQIIRGTDPCALPKACKNEVELAGIRAAHRRDGAALTRFLAWLAAAPAGSVTELDAVARLAAMRAGGEDFRGPSFDTISGAGPNGAIVHYRVTAETNRRAGAGHALPRRLRRAILGRYHRRDPHGRDRRARGGASGPLHPRAARPYCARPGALPARHHRRTVGHACPSVPVAGGPRLRSRHRARRGPLPERARRPAAHLTSGLGRGAGARHGRLQRARLLQDRRLRHPHRKPGGGDRSRWGR